MQESRPEVSTFQFPVVKMCISGLVLAGIHNEQIGLVGDHFLQDLEDACRSVSRYTCVYDLDVLVRVQSRQPLLQPKGERSVGAVWDSVGGGATQHEHPVSVRRFLSRKPLRDDAPAWGWDIEPAIAGDVAHR